MVFYDIVVVMYYRRINMMMMMKMKSHTRLQLPALC